MVSVPVRDVVLELAAIENETVPLPVLLEPAVIVIQLVLLFAVQLQVLAEAATPTLTAAVAAPTEELVVDKENEQEVVGGSVGDGTPAPLVAPACVTVNVLPATVSVPVRRVELKLILIEK